MKPVKKKELAVFHSIKSLLSSEFKEKLLRITVLTAATQKVFADDIVKTKGSGIAGLIGSLAKEQPHWKIRIIDLYNRKTTKADIEKLLKIPYDKEGKVTAFRNGFTYQHKLYPLSLPKKHKKAS